MFEAMILAVVVGQAEPQYAKPTSQQLVQERAERRASNRRYRIQQGKYQPTPAQRAAYARRYLAAQLMQRRAHAQAARKYQNNMFQRAFNVRPSGWYFAPQLNRSVYLGDLFGVDSHKCFH